MEVYKHFREKHLISDLFSHLLFKQRKSIFLTKIEENKKPDRFCHFQLSLSNQQLQADWRITFIMTSNRKHFSVYVSKQNLFDEMLKFQNNMFKTIDDIMNDEKINGVIKKKRKETPMDIWHKQHVLQKKYNLDQSKDQDDKGWELIP